MSREKVPPALGLVAALVILAAWTAGMLLLLTRGDPWAPWAPLAVLLQTFLHTGLFITAHDAMHGTVWPRRPRVNRAVGRLALALYALFPFAALEAAHKEHHRAPASEHDPDYAAGGRTGFWPWYGAFIRRYLSAWQLVGMAAIFNVLEHGLGLPAPRLVLFWVVPSLLSTLQLFYFGTYLPHRPARGRDLAHHDHHRARSTALSPLGSLLTCYHFGRHWQHHARPDLPWWRLTEVAAPEPREAGTARGSR